MKLEFMNYCATYKSVVQRVEQRQHQLNVGRVLW